MKRLIELQARHGQLAAAARLWDELVRALPDSRLENPVLLRIVPELIVQAHREAAIGALRIVVASGRALSIGQAVRAAELAAELDPECALRAARRRSAAASSPTSPARASSSSRASSKRSSAPRLRRALVAPGSAGSRAEARARRRRARGERSDPRAPRRAQHFDGAPTNLGREGGADSTTTQTSLHVRAPRSPAERPALTRDRPENRKVNFRRPARAAPAGNRLRIDGREETVLAWERVQAVGVGLVSGLTQNRS